MECWDLHVCVSDFGHRGQPKEDDEQRDEAGDPEVDPLHVLEALLRVDRLGEEDARRQKGGDPGADTLDRLGEVESDLGVSWGATDGEEAVGVEETSVSCFRDASLLKYLSTLG